MDTETIITAVSSMLGGGLIGSVFSARSRNAKLYSDSSLALSQAYGLLIDQQQKRITQLEATNSRLERDNADLRSRLAAVEATLEAHGIA